MYKKITGMSIACLLLGGCLLHPRTKQELLDTGVASPEYCLAQDRPQVEERVQAYLNHCYHPYTVNVGAGGNVTNMISLKVDKSDERTNMLVWAPSIYGEQYYLNVVISQKNPACKTTMIAIASGSSFGRAFPKMEESANGGDPNCPFP